MQNYDPSQFVFLHGPAPLPANAPENFTPQQHTAYAVAQAVETLSQWSPVTVSTRSMSPQVAGRLLGYMLLEAPTVEGRDNVTFEIASCNGDETRLKQLGHLYAKVYIQTCESFSSNSEVVMLTTSFQSRRTAGGPLVTWTQTSHHLLYLRTRKTKKTKRKKRMLLPVAWKKPIGETKQNVSCLPVRYVSTLRSVLGLET